METKNEVFYFPCFPFIRISVSFTQMPFLSYIYNDLQIYNFITSEDIMTVTKDLCGLWL